MGQIYLVFAELQIGFLEVKLCRKAKQNDGKLLPPLSMVASQK